MWFDEPEKVVDMSRPSQNNPVYDEYTERKMRRLQKKIGRLQEKIDEEEARQREYNRLAAEVEDMERQMAILRRIIDAETPEKEEAVSGPDTTGGISMN